MHADPDPKLVSLYQRAVICQAFPGYKLDDPIPIEAAWALQLINLARQVQE